MATENKIERRIIPCKDMELRVEGEGKEARIKGYAAKFNSWSDDLGYFREKIAPGAFDKVLGNDVRCLKNHDPNLILGRTSNGTLTLESNSVGLQFTNTIPDTNTGRDTAEEIRSGLITGCSFAFTVAKDEWFEDKEHNVTRTIREVDNLYDVGPVTYPAYPDTSVAVRSLDKWKEERIGLQAYKEQQAKEQEELNGTGPDDSRKYDEEKEKEEENSGPVALTPEQISESRRLYRKAGRILNRLKKK